LPVGGAIEDGRLVDDQHPRPLRPLAFVDGDRLGERRGCDRAAAVPFCLPLAVEVPEAGSPHGELPLVPLVVADNQLVAVTALAWQYVDDVELLAVEDFGIRRVGEGDDAVSRLRSAGEAAQGAQQVHNLPAGRVAPDKDLVEAEQLIQGELFDTTGVAVPAG